MDCYGISEIGLLPQSRIGFSLPAGSDDVVGMCLLIESLSRRNLMRYGVLIRGSLKFHGAIEPAYLAVEDLLRLPLSLGESISEKIKKSLPQNFHL